ncbi:hypothetical protein [Paracoccus albus]|uniref:hypothetical protein n=1 Tax=Paracoccus albus TaxID=3017784 RepID=UPI0022F041A4|nr:hypothetical protein [Paracoccus albus]WBU60437.1 hypothetical protein PAF20_00455 [Paracoccus albus]
MAKMIKVQSLFDEAAMALREGRCEDAVDYLIEIENKILLGSVAVDAGFTSSLERLSGLADAVAAGISDARTILETAAGDIHQLRTYDGSGKERQVNSAPKSLGKY